MNKIAVEIWQYEWVGKSEWVERENNFLDGIIGRKVFGRKEKARKWKKSSKNSKAAEEEVLGWMVRLWYYVEIHGSREK